jgi:hypothetical protein
MLALWIGLVAAALVALIWSALRSRELFVLAVRQGKTRVLRGRPPHALLQDLADVFARAAVEDATVKVLRQDGRPRLEARGLDPHALQRARNVLGAYPAHKLLGSR